MTVRNKLKSINKTLNRQLEEFFPSPSTVPRHRLSHVAFAFGFLLVCVRPSSGNSENALLFERTQARGSAIVPSRLCPESASLHFVLHCAPAMGAEVRRVGVGRAVTEELLFERVGLYTKPFLCALRASSWKRFTREPCSSLGASRCVRPSDGNVFSW